MAFKKFSSLMLLVCFVSHDLAAAEFKVAVRAHQGVENARQMWQPSINVLNKAIPQHRFILVPVVSLSEITERAGRGDFDFVLTNPSSFVELEQRYEAKALMTLNNKRANSAQSRFGSVIFTHVRNKDILNINDLKGKKLMAVSALAFGGWRVAWLEMLEHGFNPADELEALLFSQSKTQAEVVYAVRDGKADAGVVRTDQLERMEADAEIDMRYFRIINNKDEQSFPFFLSTRLFPEWCFAAMKSVPDLLSQRVTTSLSLIKPDSSAAQQGKYIGWIPALDYTPVRDLMQQLKVGAYASQ